MRCPRRACAAGDRTYRGALAALDFAGRPLGRRRCDLEIRRVRPQRAVARSAPDQSLAQHGESDMTSRHLAITMGDPAGIGPEIIVKACIGLKDRIASGDLRLLIIGSGAALDGAKAALGGNVAIPQVPAGDREWPNLCYLQADAEGDPIKPGVLSADGGRFAYKAIE